MLIINVTPLSLQGASSGGDITEYIRVGGGGEVTEYIGGNLREVGEVTVSLQMVHRDGKVTEGTLRII